MLDYVEQLLAAQTVNEVWSMHAARMDAYGFDRMIYGRSFDSLKGMEKAAEDMFFLSTLPDEFNVRLQSDKLYAHTPMDAWSKPTPDVQVWAWDGHRARGSSAKARDAVTLNRSFGVSIGYTIGFGATAPCGHAGVALIARADLNRNAIDLVWELHGRKIVLMNRLAHLRISGFPMADEPRELTSRQREVLKLVAHGHTTAEIAELMGLRPVTVEKHLRLARNQLDASTSVQAVLKAALQHHILLDRD